MGGERRKKDISMGIFFVARDKKRTLIRRRVRGRTSSARPQESLCFIHSAPKGRDFEEITRTCVFTQDIHRSRTIVTFLARCLCSREAFRTLHAAAVLRRAMLSATLYHSVLRCATLSYAVLRHTALCHFCATLYYAVVKKTLEQ